MSKMKVLEYYLSTDNYALTDIAINSSYIKFTADESINVIRFCNLNAIKAKVYL